MKKRSKILKLSVLLFSFFIGIYSINAVTVTTSEYFPNNTVVKKIMSGQNAYCLDGALDAPKAGAEYSLVNQSDDNNLYYAYIINSISTGTISSETDWYNVEHALHQYVDGTSASSDIQQAVADAKSIKDGSSKITASPTSLNFTKNGNNYVATTTINGKNLTLGTCTLDQTTVSYGGTVTKNNNKLTVTVPINRVQQNHQATLTCNNSYQTYYTTKVYSCTNNCISIKTNLEANVQRLAIKEKVDVTDNVVVKGSLTAEPKGSIKIKKYGKNSQKSKKTLQGVKFKIKNKAGHYINASGEVDEDYVFTTNSSGIIQVTNIDIPDPDKSYEFTLEEVSTLSGYAKAIGTMKITLNSSNNFTYDEELVNETVRVTISKTDATGKKELPGAKLSILDKDSKILKKCVFDKDKHLITYSDGEDAVDCTWASTDVAYIFEGLPKGKYYLVEELAPEGYQKSKEKIEIEIKDTGAVKDKVVMKNALEVPVPDTLSARSALLLVVAMFDIALGIGIVTYVKKHKTEE